MSIWFKDYHLEDVQKFSRKTMAEHLGIEFTEIGEDFIKAKMPVDHRTKQPAGLLHGGASVVLAESLGSTGGYLSINPAEKTCVGIEINANHLRPVTEGFVEGVARPLHIGGRIQVWEIKIYNAQGKMVCTSRLTLAVITKDKG
jgi:1,4-dihydroxy-2-naphthoyl-CoA hydrolase